MWHLTCFLWCCAVIQMEREARYTHYVSSLQFYNLSKLDDMFRERLVYMSGLRLVELQPEVAAGKNTAAATVDDLWTLQHAPIAVCSRWEPSAAGSASKAPACGGLLAKVASSSHSIYRGMNVSLCFVLQTFWRPLRNTTSLQ